MKEKEYAIVALKDILVRALGAVYCAGWAGHHDALNVEIDGRPLLAGWDLEFAAMSRKEQVDWLVTLFEALIEHG